MRGIFLLTLFLIVTSCSLFEETPIANSLEVSIKLNSSTYNSNGSDEITARLISTEDIEGYEILWRLDNGAYKSGSSSYTFDNLTDEMAHKITALVVIDGDTVTAKTKAISENFYDFPAFTRHGKLSLNGTQIVDEDGFPTQLRGMSTHGIQYFPSFMTENLFSSVANDWGADIIRISSYVNEGYTSNGSYLTNPSYWRSFIDKMVGWAEDNNIYVLIDWHMLRAGDPNYFIEEAKEFWEYMVDKHGNKDFVLFDICNEPNNDGGGDWLTHGKDAPEKNVTWSVIKEYADQIMPIIRAKSDNIAIVGTPVWASRPDAVIGDELAYENVMYTMHFYAAAHSFATYGNYVKKAINAGIPVFVTEFGSQEASGNGDDDFNEADKWMDYLNSNKISWCNWNLSNDYRTGAVYKTSFDGGSASDYANKANMKEAGQWIFDQIQDR